MTSTSSRKVTNGAPRSVEEALKSSTGKVKVAVSDIDGILRGKYLHKEKFDAIAKDGFGFCDVVFGWDCHDLCYDNTRFTGWHTGYPDAHVLLDLTTARVIPWEDNTPFYLGDFVHEGKPLAVCPRQVLRRVVQRLEDAGYDALTGFEFEWFNFRENSSSLKDKNYSELNPLTHGMYGYSILRSGQNSDFFHALMDELNAFGVPLEGLHTETGPGVLEAAIICSDALEAADRAILFKTAVKTIGHRFGIMPTFMARWTQKLPGCSGHIHQSLWKKGTKQNIFEVDGKSKALNEGMAHFLAGQLKLLPDLLPFFAPTVNSYKRLVEGYWAPTKVSWGFDNRTVAFRVIPGSKKSTRIETRVSGSDVNPYLAAAASLASGLYGLENKVALDLDPCQGSAYHHEGGEPLARTLQEATEKMSHSRIARELFGDAFIDHFAATREWEWKQYAEAVTKWELERYFEII